MTFEFKILDNDGTVLTQGKEEVAQNFSVHDFLNKTVPGWEATVKVFYDRTVQGFETRGSEFVNAVTGKQGLEEPKVAPQVAPQPTQANAPSAQPQNPTEPKTGV